MDETGVPDHRRSDATRCGTISRFLDRRLRVAHPVATPARTDLQIDHVRSLPIFQILLPTYLPTFSSAQMYGDPHQPLIFPHLPLSFLFFLTTHTVLPLRCTQSSTHMRSIASTLASHNKHHSESQNNYLKFSSSPLHASPPPPPSCSHYPISRVLKRSLQSKLPPFLFSKLPVLSPPARHVYSAPHAFLFFPYFIYIYGQTSRALDIHVSTHLSHFTSYTPCFPPFSCASHFKCYLFTNYIEMDRRANYIHPFPSHSVLSHAPCCLHRTAACAAHYSQSLRPPYLSSWSWSVPVVACKVEPRERHRSTSTSFYNNAKSLPQDFSKSFACTHRTLPAVHSYTAAPYLPTPFSKSLPCVSCPSFLFFMLWPGQTPLDADAEATAMLGVTCSKTCIFGSVFRVPNAPLTSPPF